MYLEHIDSPCDVKKLTTTELNILCQEIRHVLLQRLSRHGGHVGPNLGMVEATVALHYVFDSPNDKIVFDVSHQSYTHKILTGRKNSFTNPDEYDQVSGYTEPSESIHDHFVIGHTSTSISLACGLAKGRDLLQKHENIIAVIGDGSLSGGEALEGLNNAGEQNSNLIIVLNDNQMSIAENHGGMYRNLEALRNSNGNASCNLFKAIGLDYLYVANGNSLTDLIHAFQQVKDTVHPVVVHINTVKGKGYDFAEQQKETFHYRTPFNLETGALNATPSDINYHDLTCRLLLQEMKADPTVVAITAATPTVMGFTADRRAEAGQQFIDVGIAEEHAVALASGIAAAGGKPVFGVYSTFIQRAYDQLSQDLCINNNPALLLVYLGSLSGMNDVTHLGFFDIPLLANIPNMVYLAPTNRNEFQAMMQWGIHQTQHPVAIRVPMGTLADTSEETDTNYGLLNRYQTTQHGSQIAILALGSFYTLGQEVAKKLDDICGIQATLINPRYITGLDTELLEALKTNHQLVITLEDGVLDGGWGEKISRFYGTSTMKVRNYGANKAFVDRFDLAPFLQANRLTSDQIVADIQALL